MSGSNAKGLEISVAIKQSEVQTMVRALQTVVKTLQDAERAATGLNKALGAGTGTGGGVPGGSRGGGLSALSGKDSKLAKGVAETSKVFEMLGTTTGKTLKTMQDAADNHLGEMIKKYGILTEKVEKLRDAQERAAQRPGYHRTVGKLGRQLTDLEVERHDLDKDLSKKGAQRYIDGSSVKEGPSASSGVMALVNNAGIIAHVAKTVFQSYAQGQANPANNRAAVSSVYGGMYSRYTQGDFGDFMGLAGGVGRKNFSAVSFGPQSHLNVGDVRRTGNAADRAATIGGLSDTTIGAIKIGLGGAAMVGAGALATSTGVGAVGGLPAMAAGGLALGSALGIGSGISDLTSASNSLFQGGADAQKAHAINAAIANTRDNPEAQAALSNMVMMGNARMNMAQTHGGLGNYFRNTVTGASFGMDEGQSAAMMNQLGGQLGSTRGNMVFGRAAGIQKQYGISKDSVAGILGGLDKGAGGDTHQAMDNLEKIMARAFQTGIKDSQMNEQIAQAIAQTQATMGTGGSGGTKAAEAMIAAMGADPSMRTVQSVLQGQQELGSMFQGKGGLFKAQSHMAAGVNLRKFGIKDDEVMRSGLETATIEELRDPSPRMKALYGDQAGALGKAQIQSQLDIAMAEMPADIRNAYERGGIGAITSDPKLRGRAAEMMKLLGLSSNAESAGSGLDILSVNPDRLRKVGSEKPQMGGDAGIAEKTAVGAATAGIDPFVKGMEKWSAAIEDAVTVATNWNKAMDTSKIDSPMQAVDEAIEAIRKLGTYINEITGARHSMSESLTPLQ